VKKLFGKVSTFIKNVFVYWNKPREGEFVPNKELASFALGCTGTIIIDAISIGFSAGCFLVGAIYKITFKDIFIIGLLNVPFNLIFQPISMIITDNLGHVPKKTMKWLHMIMIPSIVLGGALMIFSPTSFMENILPAFGKIVGWIPFSWSVVQYLNILFLRWLSPKFGKFRTSILYGCIPGIISMLLLVYLPFMDYAYPMRLFLLNLIFSMFNTYKGAFTGQRGNLQNVISPSSEERIKINTFMVVLLAPVYGIINVVTPVFSTMTGGMTSYNTYRVLLPVFFGIGVPLTLFMAFGVKDRIILEKNHVTDISMFAGFKQVLKNKYLWILYISDNIQSIQNGCVAIINIVIIYMLRQDWMLGVILTVTGFFGFPGVFLAPWLSKKIGKRNMVLMARFLYYSYFICAIISIQTGSLIILLAGIVLSNLFNQSGYIARDTMNSDMWDYQQYISGKRMESSMGILGTLGSPVVTMLGMLVPAVYSMIGFTNDWNMLYVPHIRTEILFYTILINVAAHTLGTIPFFFYDLTEKKHKEIMTILEERKRQKEAGQEAQTVSAE
jgi:GPH family glycoside/pentoside/hexuronide:cation symporter